MSHRAVGVTLFRWTAVVAVAVVAVIAALASRSATAQYLRDNPALNLKGIGHVNAVLFHGGQIYIGGAFSYADGSGNRRVNLARLNSNGTLDTSFDIRATSTVHALAVIGNTLYIGGAFTGLSQGGAAGVQRNRLGAVNLTNNTIAAWNPGADDEVFALAVDGTNLYVGGAFGVAGGQPLFGLGRFVAGSASADPTWLPQPAHAFTPGQFATIRTIVSFGGLIYVGGIFTHIGPSPVCCNESVAALSPTTAAPTAWNPVVQNGTPGPFNIADVRTIVPTATVTYLGGVFTSVGIPGVNQQDRIGIAAVSTSGQGQVNSWNPGMLPPQGGGTVRRLVLDAAAGTIFAGGEFTAMGSLQRKYAAAIETATYAITSIACASGTATATLAAPNTTIATGQSVTIAGNSVGNYWGIRGPITVVDQTHFTFPATCGGIGNGGEFSRNSNARPAFNANLDDNVSAMVQNGTTLYMGGDFTRPSGAFGGFGTTSGANTVVGNVFDVASVWQLLRQSNGKTVVAGDFYLNSGGSYYRGLLRLNADDTLDTGWNPVVHGQVVAAALGPAADNTVLIGGSFDAVGATARKNIAAVSLATGAATAFSADPNSAIRAIAVDGTTAYVGGSFTGFGGTARNFLASLNASTGALGTFNPGADGPVNAIATNATHVFAGGLFGQAGGSARFNVAKFTKAGALDAWNPGASEEVHGITVNGNDVFIAGNFTVATGDVRNYVKAVHATTGALATWNPNPDYIVLKVIVPAQPANTVYLAGAFIHVGGLQTGNAAAVDMTTGEAQEWYPLMNDAVYTLIPDATRVLVGGVFETSQFVLPANGVAAFTRTIGEFAPTFNVWRKSDGTNASWDYVGPSPQQVVSTFLPGVPTSWQARGLGDVDGDGITDVAWFQPSSGQVAIWRMSSATSIAAAAFPASVGAGTSWQIVGVGDVDGDGFGDLVWRDGTGRLLVWYLNSTGTISGTKDFGIVPTSYELIRGTGDFNADGVDDLLFYRQSDGQAVIYLMNSNRTTFTPAFPQSVGPGSSWRPHRIGDFDGDGRADIFWREESAGFTVVWYMNGGALADFDFFVSVPFPAWTAGRREDFDFDGRQDIVWHDAGGNVVRWLFRGRHVAPDVQALPSVGAGWSTVP